MRIFYSDGKIAILLIIIKHLCYFNLSFIKMLCPQVHTYKTLNISYIHSSLLMKFYENRKTAETAPQNCNNQSFKNHIRSSTLVKILALLHILAHASSIVPLVLVSYSKSNPINENIVQTSR